MKEQVIQSKIIKDLESRWYIVIKITVSNMTGIPDLLVLTGWGKHLWIEVKKPDGVESKLQEFRRKKFTEHWDVSIVCYGYEDFIRKYNNL
jgi:hypothetical protein